MIKKNQKNLNPHDTPPQDKRLGRMVMLSGLLHAGLLLALVSAADPPQSKPWTPQSYTVSLVAPAALGLAPEPPPAPRPKKVESAAVEPLPKPKPEQPKVEVKKPKTEKKPKAVKSKKKKSVQIASKKKPSPKKAPLKTVVKKPQTQKPEQAKKPPLQPSTPKEPEEQRLSVEDREQQIVAALEKIRQRVQADQRQTAEPSHSTSASGGGGGSGTLRGLPFILYTQEVKQRVKQSWIVAEHKSGLTAVVRFGILANGEIVGVELAERSGDIVFDESAMRAVRKAHPLPPPPEAYRNEFTRQKIEVVFGEPRRARSQQVRSE